MHTDLCFEAKQIQVAPEFITQFEGKKALLQIIKYDK